MVIFLSYNHHYGYLIDSLPYTENRPMPNPIPVAAPAAYAPLSAIGFAETDNNLSTVSANKPLSVNTTGVPTPAALSGSAKASTLAGPLAPNSSKPVKLSLSGAWTSMLRLNRVHLQPLDYRGSFCPNVIIEQSSGEAQRASSPSGATLMAATDNFPCFRANS